MSNTTWKGFERKIVRWIRDGLGIEAERNIQESRNGNEGDIHGGLRSWSPEGGNGGGQEVAKLVGQAKFRSAPSPWKAQEEADQATTSPSDIAFGVVRRKGDQTIVTLRPAVFGAMLYIVSRTLAAQGEGAWHAAYNRASDHKDCP